MLKYSLKHGISLKINDKEIESKFDELYSWLLIKKLVNPEDTKINKKLRSMATNYLKQNRFNKKKDIEILSEFRKEKI